MLRKQLEIPPQAAKAFVRDMRAFFKATGHDADKIAADAGWKLQQHLPRGTKLRLSDVKQLFHQMRDHA
jgi:Xaa-Pro aminopeptidase